MGDLAANIMTAIIKSVKLTAPPPEFELARDRPLQVV